MLMMGFFVILWVLKPNGGKPATAEADEKWLEVVAKIRDAFDYLPDPTSKDPVDIHILMKKLEENHTGQPEPIPKHRPSGPGNRRSSALACCSSPANPN